MLSYTFSLAIVLQCLITFAFGIEYRVYDLQTENSSLSLCGQPIIVPCPDAQGQAGTLRFLARGPRAPAACSVQLSLARGCGYCNTTRPEYGFYFNFRNVSMYGNDYVQLPYATPDLIFRNSVAPTNFPPSVAQYKTRLSEVPQSISIEYHTDFEPSAPFNNTAVEVVIDYVVTESTWGNLNRYCSALGAFMNRGHICDAKDDRINCPINKLNASYPYSPAAGRLCTEPAVLSPDFFNQTYPLINIERRCADVVTIPCPTQTKGRAGRLQFSYLPNDNCEVTVQLERNCTTASLDSFAIYVNFRQINTVRGHSFELHESNGSNRTLAKQFMGPVATAGSAHSAAQYLTSYSVQPVVHLVNNRTNAQENCVATYNIVMDYTVLYGTSAPSTHSTYCSALKGFIQNDLLCTSWSSRINCPGFYRPSLGENPAEYPQCRAGEEGEDQYPGTYLSDDADTVTIPCPTFLKGRAGSFSAGSYPKVTFSVNITLPSDCGSDEDTFALYINIRRLDLPPGDAVAFYKKYPGEAEMRREKYIPGPTSFGNSEQLSIAQYLTPYEKQPFVSFKFEHGDSQLGNTTDMVYMDYAVYSKNNRNGSYCPSLNGSISEDLLCSFEGDLPRISCPSSYNFSTGVNPATGPYCTKAAPSTSSTTSRTTSRTASRATSRSTTRVMTRPTSRSTAWWEVTPWRPSFTIPTYTYRPYTYTREWWSYTTSRPYSSSSGLTGGEIAGIIIGTLFVFIVFAVNAKCRAKRCNGEGYSGPVTFSGNRNADRPVVIGSNAEPNITGPAPPRSPRLPYPANSQLPYPPSTRLASPPAQNVRPLDLPPSYEEVVVNPPYPTKEETERHT